MLLDNQAGSHFMRVTIASNPERPANSAPDWHLRQLCRRSGDPEHGRYCVWVTGTIADNGREYDFARWGWCG